jgi:hypothetical protein
MKDIIKVQIQLLPEHSPATPWLVRIYSSTDYKQQRFFSLHDVIVWLIEEEEEE